MRGRSDTSIDLRNLVSGQRRRIAAAPSQRKRAPASPSSTAAAPAHEFTPEDDVVVVRCVAVQGTDWAHVATLQPLGGGVSADDVRKRWSDCLEPALLRRLPGANDAEAAHFARLREEFERLAGAPYEGDAALPLDLRSGGKRKRRVEPPLPPPPPVVPEPQVPQRPAVIDLVESDNDEEEEEDEVPVAGARRVSAIVFTKHRGRRVDLSAHFKKRKHKHHHCGQH